MNDVAVSMHAVFLESESRVSIVQKSRIWLVVHLINAVILLFLALEQQTIHLADLTKYHKPNTHEEGNTPIK